jgi:hypothetical protein
VSKATSIDGSSLICIHTGGPATVRPFSFAGWGGLVSSVGVKRSVVRGFLMFALLLSAGFAAWSWLRPYSWESDPAARCKMVGTQVEKDYNHFWVNVHLEISPGASHDLMKPVRLITGAGREVEPADTTLGGMAGGETTDLWFKFWLEESDLGGPLKLRINDGLLEIRTGSGLPRLGKSNSEYFTTSRW